MRRNPFAAVALAAACSLAAAGGASADTGPPGNLGNGLSRLIQPPAAKSGVRITQAPLAIRDKAGRVLVDVGVADAASLAAAQQRTAGAGLTVVARDTGTKVIEGFVALSDVAELAKVPGVATVAQALKPRLNVGAATSQGVVTQRVDQVRRGIDGRGITVGALSDSFDTATETVFGDPLSIHAKEDIASGDLPADGVTVLEDDHSGATTDEGRAMLQIVHDVAPRAKECFATADGGEVGFANNIRALADKSGRCGADVVVDDVTYFSEPFFSRGVIGDAADDVAAQGTHYFSSAGNDGEQQAYRAPLRLVAPDPATAAAGTNIKLDQVPRELYAGGFHDFDPGPGQDIAQSMTVGSPVDDNGDPTGGLAILDMQWDDPFDANGPQLGDPLLDTTGEVTTANPTPRFTFTGKGGTTVRAIVDAIPSGTTDLILKLIAPDGTTLQDVDTGGTPEVVVQKLPVDGDYTLEVRGFNGATGDFTLKAQPVLGNTRTTTDLNALLFDEDGNFLGALGDLNQLTGRPAEIAAFLGAGPIQLVISKANTDGGSATQVAYLAFDDLQQTEWTQPLAPAIIGHPLARGATAVAAVDPFAPFAPEDFTSPGGDLPIFFDTDGNRLPKPDIRRVPQVAATDGGNTTFFVSDNVQDPDTQPNFFGTSAAAPHAAAIAALALQAAGGPGSLSPDAMRSLLQRSTFRHDLDPFHSDASDRGLTITADGAPGFEHSLTRPWDESTGGMDDERFFTVRYSGRGSIVRLVLDGVGANPTGLTGRGLFDRGLVFDPRPFLGYPANGAPELWQQGFPFTVGAASAGITPADVRASFARPGVGLANAQQFQQMALSFTPGKLTGGRSVSFGTDRDEAVTAFGDAEAGNSADQLGEGVLFPSGRVVGPGLLYTALTSDGRVIRGTLDNRVGEGFSPVDGYGYINAQEAVERARGARSRGR